LNYKLTDRRAGDIASLYAATERTEKQLGWKAQKGIDEMIRSSWEWEQYYRSQQ
jgi:UDP-glucose 4-epimerase